MSADPHATPGFWPSIVRIAVLQAATLLVLAGAFVAYVDWSSDVAFAEFLAASQAHASSSVSLQDVRMEDVKLPCSPNT